ncbi:uncharacterized protein B0T23DRAFT_380415, partial [Neurospora hispaniola]
MNMVYRLVNIQRWSCGPNSPSPFSLPSKLLGFSCCLYQPCHPRSFCMIMYGKYYFSPPGFTGGPDGLVGNKSRRRLLLPINRALSHITAKVWSALAPNLRSLL